MIASLILATALSAMSATDVRALGEELLRPRATQPDDYRELILEIWAQVPNWKGSDPMWLRRPEPVWTPPPVPRGQKRPKRPEPHDPEAVDWLAALESLDLAAAGFAGVTDPPTAKAEAIEIVRILRTLGASERAEAVHPIFELAFRYEGVFRDECGRQLRALGAHAIPALVRLWRQPGTQQLGLIAKQRRYALYQLDRMDRARPHKALAAAPTDTLRAEMLRAYGDTRAPDAVEAVLAHVDAASHRVRKEARAAWLRYVTGPPPPPAPKRKRKLPGGQEEDEEKPDYLTYREVARIALVAELSGIKEGAAIDPNATEAALTEELFRFYDDRRAAVWDSAFARASERFSSGDVKTAAEECDWILVNEPAYRRRVEIAPIFVAHADSLEKQAKPSEAVGYLRKAIALAPQSAEPLKARVQKLDR